jgi:POT family proton-dependent oligopeptide transporter
LILPNDTIQALNPIACLLLGPIIQNALFPTLLKHQIWFGPIAHMTAAFVTMSAAMAYAAGLQSLIDKTEPCYESPLACPALKNCSIPNSIKVRTQSPIYFLLALAEIFRFATLSEHSYSKSPRNMQVLVQALRQVSVQPLEWALTSSGGSEGLINGYRVSNSNDCFCSSFLVCF